MQYLCAGFCGALSYVVYSHLSHNHYMQFCVCVFPLIIYDLNKFEGRAIALLFLLEEES